MVVVGKRGPALAQSGRYLAGDHLGSCVTVIGPLALAGGDVRPWSCPGGWYHSQDMFAVQEAVLDIDFGAARARLVNLIAGGTLTGASRAAYDEGLGVLMRVGPFGDLPAASKLVKVRFLEPADRDDGMRAGLRWEAVGLTGGLCPVLDSDITVTPAGERTRLVLAGAYRPPLGRLGAGVDRAVLHHVADATIRALLHHVADALTSPQRQPRPESAAAAARCYVRPARPAKPRKRGVAAAAPLDTGHPGDAAAAGPGPAA